MYLTVRPWGDLDNHQRYSWHSHQTTRASKGQGVADVDGFFILSFFICPDLRGPWHDSSRSHGGALEVLTEDPCRCEPWLVYGCPNLVIGPQDLASPKYG